MDEHGTSRRIAQSLVRWLEGYTFEDEAARAAARLELGGWLGRLIGEHLDDEPEWSPWWHLDDAAPEDITTLDGLSVDVSGVAWLLADSSAGDRHPFSATLRLTPSRETLASYTIRFGDAAVGLGPNPEAERQRRRWPDVHDWIFTFEGPAAEAGDIAAR